MHVAETAKYILETLDFPPRTVELARIAGYLHDIGNLVNRVDHSQSGAVMAWSILNDMGCDHRHCHWQSRRGQRRSRK